MKPLVTDWLCLCAFAEASGLASGNMAFLLSSEKWGHPNLFINKPMRLGNLRTFFLINQFL